MFDRIKQFFTREEKVPTVQITGFTRGLLSFRSESALGLKETSIRAETPGGDLETTVDIQSYDPRNKTYLAKVEPGDKTLESLDVDLSKIASISKVLKVTSPDLPAYAGLTEEISPSGIRLSTTESLPEGQVLTLTIQFDVPQIPNLKTEAVVEWCALKSDNTYHSGIRFRNLSAQNFGKLARYIQLALRR